MDKEDILCIIKECACSLAEKELIDKYGKLPEQLITQNGTYLSLIHISEPTRP